MIDTSVMVAGLVPDHVFHERARPYLAATLAGKVPGIVLAESWAVLRRAPWLLESGTVAEVLKPWASAERVAVTPADAYVNALREGATLNLGANVHDMLIAYTCSAAGLPLVTLDRQQAALAATLPRLEVVLLLDGDVS